LLQSTAAHHRVHLLKDKETQWFFYTP